jgi:hypothetical protein
MTPESDHTREPERLSDVAKAASAPLEELRHELEDAFRNRAHLYRLFLDELESEIGPERAERLMSRALEHRGAEVAPVLFQDLAPDPKVIGERFLSVSPAGGTLYPHSCEAGNGLFTIRVARCPLQDAWIEAGLPPERIATLCRIAGAFDKGLFEAAGVCFSNETWSEARGGGCCWIALGAPSSTP